MKLINFVRQITHLSINKITPCQAVVARQILYFAYMEMLTMQAFVRVISAHLRLVHLTYAGD